MLLFPNPSTGLVNFSCSAGDRIRVTDALGRVVHEQLAEGNLTNMDLSALPSGIYLVQAGNATGSLLLIAK